MADKTFTQRVSDALTALGGLLSLGETSTTAYRGDRGKIAYDHSQITTGNPHGTTATDVDALKRDGSNANSDVDLGAFALNVKSLKVNGTGGNGNIGLKHQSAGITANASESAIGADSAGDPVWKNDSNPIQKIIIGDATTQSKVNAIDQSVSATEKSTWNAKQDALGYTPLDRNNNLSDLQSAATARTNLGLGTLATQSGTFSGTSSGVNNGDETINTILTKLAPVTNTSVFTGTANTTATETFLTMSFSANDPRLSSGACFKFDAWGTQSQAAVSNNVSFSIAITQGSTTLLSIGTVNAGASAQTNREVNFIGSLSFLNIGASGTVIAHGMTQVSGVLPVSTSPSVTPTSINTTQSFTITLRCANSAANAANIIRVVSTSIYQVK